MDQAHLEKLRRFALAMGLIVLTWSMAGISLADSGTVTVLGIPFRVSRPELLPFGFAAAAFYGALRYLYYAIMLATSPYRLRRDLLDELLISDAKGEHATKAKKAIPTYWGPTHFTTTPWNSDYNEVQARASALKNAFPKVGTARVTVKVLSHLSFDSDGQEYTVHNFALHVPVWCRIAAFLQDLDYTSPAWFPMSTSLWLLVQSRLSLT